MRVQASLLDLLVSDTGTALLLLGHGATQEYHDYSVRHAMLANLSVVQQLARLVQRAGIFAARLSPLKKRQAMSATAAAKAVYLDEFQKPDEAGSAIIKAFGLHPPGCLVQLKSGGSRWCCAGARSPPSRWWRTSSQRLARRSASRHCATRRLHNMPWSPVWRPTKPRCA